MTHRTSARRNYDWTATAVWLALLAFNVAAWVGVILFFEWLVP